MARYIDADECLDTMRDEMAGTGYQSIAMDIIKYTPTADVVEVKRGHWIDKPSGRYLHIASWCSVCGNKSGIGGIESNRHKPYCPNCGAKMDGITKEGGREM